MFLGMIPPDAKASLDSSALGLGSAIDHADRCISRNPKGTLDGDYWRDVMQELIKLCPEG